MLSAVMYAIWVSSLVELSLTTNLTHILQDILDDLVFQKINESDCSHFARLYPWMPSQAWGAVWFTVSFLACKNFPLQVELAAHYELTFSEQ